MDKSPLVEVLHSFASLTVTKNSCEFVGDGISMCNDTGMRFLDYFGCRKIYWEISCTFAGTGIWMPMYPGNNFFYEIWSLKILVA